MHDDNPYRSPATLERYFTPPLSASSQSAIATLAFIALPIVGGIAGFTGYLFAATIFENRDTTIESILTYGQQAGLISLPMCTLICAAIGLALAFSFIRQYAIAILILLLASMSGWAINNSFWSDQIRTHGPDPSEVVLYYPPLECSGMALSTAAIVAVWALLTHRKKVT
jgi:hypothetical protein